MKLSRSGRATLASVVWLLVSAMLIYRGLKYFPAIQETWVKVLTISLAVVIGVAKGLFVLSKSAARTAGFIQRRPEQDWFWFCFHPILYLLIPLMILMGWGLRHYYGESHPAVVVGVYVGVGVAMLAAVRGMRQAQVA
ncbi:MAG: hypothetical protein KDB53_08620 [Planctomycetes bacterium]|nr:hypothetical protein [Planctomycetota bacterium]